MIQIQIHEGLYLVYLLIKILFHITEMPENVKMYPTLDMNILYLVYLAILYVGYSPTLYDVGWHGLSDVATVVNSE